MGLFSRTDDHQWSQQHLSHYVEGDLGRRARRRLDRHAEDCADCGRGVRSMRALLRLIPGLEGPAAIRAPAGIFDRVRSSGTESTDDDGAPTPPSGE
jgi:anti-sigma factor RsiW